MSEKMETTKERILEVANQCTTVEKALKGLFPEAFAEQEGWEIFVPIVVNSTFSGGLFLVDATNNKYILFISLPKGGIELISASSGFFREKRRQLCDAMVFKAHNIKENTYRINEDGFLERRKNDETRS